MSTVGTSAFIGAVALLGCACGVSTLARAEHPAGPFFKLTGTWSGRGQVRLEGGRNESIACKAYYTPRDGGNSVGIALRCASTSYSIHLRSSLNAAGGRVSGSWEEETFGASGSVSGRASDGNLAVSISGGGFAGSMSVSFGGSTQQVSIITSGTTLKGVSISLTRIGGSS